MIDKNRKRETQQTTKQEGQIDQPAFVVGKKVTRPSRQTPKNRDTRLPNRQAHSGQIPKNPSRLPNRRAQVRSVPQKPDAGLSGKLHFRDQS